MSLKLSNKINQITTYLFDDGPFEGVELENEISNLLSEHFPVAYEKAENDAKEMGNSNVLPGDIVGYISEGSNDEKECLMILDNWFKKIKKEG